MSRLWADESLGPVRADTNPNTGRSTNSNVWGAPDGTSAAWGGELQPGVVFPGAEQDATNAAHYEMLQNFYNAIRPDRRQIRTVPRRGKRKTCKNQPSVRQPGGGKAPRRAKKTNKRGAGYCYKHRSRRTSKNTKKSRSKRA